MRRQSPVTDEGREPRVGAVRSAGAALALAACLGTASFAEPTPADSAWRDDLYATAFVDAQQGWAVGAFGAILRTTDGGRSWQAQRGGTGEPLYGVDFVDRRHGWAVGRAGLIVHTDDGGETWQRQDSGVAKHLFSVDFADARTGIATGDWGVVITTGDGGRTWHDHSLTDDVVLNDVAMVDQALAWSVGERGTVLVTRDGGRTWSAQQSGVDKTLFGVTFIDARRGWVVGIDGLILHTEDGGETWQRLHGSSEPRALEQVGFGMAYDNPSLYAVQVVGDLGIAVGELGAVLVSADGGHTWTRQPSRGRGEPRWYRDVALVAGAHGAIVGANGRLRRVIAGHIEAPVEAGRAGDVQD